MEKLRFGTKEIIATVVAVIVILASKWLETILERSGMPAAILLEWVKPRVLVVAIAAVFFGPWAGMIGGLGGELLINVVFGNIIGYPEIIAMGIYGLFLGLYFGKTHFNIQNFDGRGWIDFNVVQLMAGTFISIFFIPMLSFFIEGSDLNESVVIGAKNTAGNALVVGIICPVIMMIVSAAGRGRRRTAP